MRQAKLDEALAGKASAEEQLAAVLADLENAKNAGGNVAGLQLQIDELLIKRYPIVAGGGKPMFAGGFGPQYFSLTDHHTFDNGVSFMTYRR